MIWQIIKNSAVDIWDEMLYLMIFNIIWLIGLVLVIPWPLVTFGLFFTVYDIGESKGISLGKFWNYARRNWKQAYLWGGINLAVLVIAWSNLIFYARQEAQWAAFLEILIIGVCLLWIIWQLVALSFFPRLEQPGLKLALRNAGISIGRYPLLTLLLIIFVILILALASFFPVVMLLGAISMIAVVTNRIVEVVVKKEKQRLEERGA
jgi:uncharacterized membrane protein YesL